MKIFFKILGSIFLLIILYISLSGKSTLVFNENVRTQALEWEKINLEATQMLSDYLKIPTIRGDEVKAVLFLKTIFEKENIAFQIIPTADPKRPIILAELGNDSGGKEGIILANHSDVVEANKAEWESDPYSGNIKDGYIWGRGAIDMKGMAIMQLMAFIQLKRNNIKLKNPVMYLSLPDEETSGLGAKEFIKHPEILKNYKYVLNEGGIGTQGIPTPGIKIFNIQFAEKGMVWIDVLAEGESGHGSTPFPNYASKKILSFLDTLVNKNQSVQITEQTELFFSQMGTAIGGYKEFLLKRSANPFIKPLLTSFIRSNKHLNAITSNTRSITNLSTPQAKGYNVISNTASARVDFRILPNTTTEKFISEIEKIAKDHDVKIKVFNKLEPTQSNMDTIFFKTLATVAQNNSTNAVVTPFMSPGLTDNNTLRSAGLICYGLIPGLFSSEEISGMHGKNERISIENLKLGTKILFETLISLN